MRKKEAQLLRDENARIVANALALEKENDELRRKLGELLPRPQHHACVRCGAAFRSNAYQAKYCTVKCRQTAQKRRYRRRKKEREGAK